MHCGLSWESEPALYENLKDRRRTSDGLSFELLLIVRQSGYYRVVKINNESTTSGTIPSFIASHGGTTEFCPNNHSPRLYICTYSTVQLKCDNGNPPHVHHSYFGQSALQKLQTTTVYIVSSAVQYSIATLRAKITIPQFVSALGRSQATNLPSLPWAKHSCFQQLCVLVESPERFGPGLK